MFTYPNEANTAILNLFLFGNEASFGVVKSNAIKGRNINASSLPMQRIQYHEYVVY